MRMDGPIPDILARCAAEDVSQLIPLAEAMAAELGSIWVGHVLSLSRAYSQTHFDAPDKDTAKGGYASPTVTKLVPWLERLEGQVPRRA